MNIGNKSSVISPQSSVMRQKITCRIFVFWITIFLTIFAQENLSPQHQHTDTMKDEKTVQTERKIKFWTCAMHPQIKLNKPGQCPICFMNLIPVYEEGTAGEEKKVSRLTLSETARKFAEIETSVVAFRPMTFEVKLFGKVEYDETKIATISAWIPGRVDKLYINYLGAYIKKGEPLFQIYSPELRTGQEEYLIAFRRYRQALEKKDPAEINSSKVVKESLQKKLELWGIMPEQVKKLEERNYASDRMDIYAPISGIITEKEAFEGKYFMTGEILFKIAELNTLWIKLDAYEKDLAYLSLGQKINFVTETFPGEIFSGRVVFIDPFINEMTRTAKVRLEISNTQGKLKPGMFGHSILKRDLGKKLSIPATAPLLTGKRAVVYVEVEPNVFEGREVILGPRAGDFYPVISGLKAGEKVVTRGNFKIDASLQIQAKPSMMKPKEEKPEIKVTPPLHQH